MKEDIISFFKSLQDNICKGLESLDGKATFREDLWERSAGGGGRSRIIQDGAIFEKGGVNFSAVTGTLPEKIASALQVASAKFLATGVSIVIHPKNPWVPIIHMNIRYFELSDGTYWFGGGIDLTPIYVIPEDAAFFHQQLKNTCDKHSAEYYPRFKSWADDYFYIPHRGETRGIGGIFFDKLASENSFSKEQRWAFVKNVGETFLPTYQAIVNKYKNKTYTEREKEWQLVRRGRYVEFNLVYDKGTKFGLDTDGRTESILMSLPPQANWIYDFQTKAGSLEEKTQQSLRKGIEWLAESKITTL